MQNQIEVADDSVAEQGLRRQEMSAMADLYRFVGRLLEAEFDTDLLHLIRGPMRESLQATGFSLDRDFLDTPEDALLEALAEEYTALFVAPGAISPYASVNLTGTLFKEPCDRATAAYQRHGWEFNRIMSGEFPDHVGVMVSFLGELSAAEARALEDGDLQRADTLAAERDSFLLEELGSWAIGWANRAAQAAEIGFYQELLEMTGQLLWNELARVADRRQLQELAEQNNQEPPRLDYDADFRKASGL